MIFVRNILFKPLLVPKYAKVPFLSLTSHILPCFRFYVGCDYCGNWYHGSCIGITEAKSKTINEYVCDECTRAKKGEELFCLCKKPYDERL